MTEETEQTEELVTFTNKDGKQLTAEKGSAVDIGLSASKSWKKSGAHHQKKHDEDDKTEGDADK